MHANSHCHLAWAYGDIEMVQAYLHLLVFLLLGVVA